MAKARRYHITLRRIRLRSGLTQAQVADLVGESQSYVSKYENGEQRLDLYEIEKICNSMDVSLLEFIRMYCET